ncbi:MAG: DUF3833 domain-containing protein [Rhodobacteraceae bacterium]|jgi:hypothetical protein|nr:DUF3833 domain-containing protein [Paracoccaceae bacterium]
MKKILTVLVLAGLTACTGKPDLSDTTLSERDLNLEEFFEGETVAYGQFQDVLGNVQRRFKVEINGAWDGRILTLVEDFVYDDGATERRTWTLEKTGKDTWKGTAPGVIGEALGKERGDTFNWKYQIDLPIKTGTMLVKFDDWMWLMAEDRLLNRAYVTRYGVRIGEAIISFEKE